MPDPTPEMYAELQTAFEHFNAELFGGTLPACLLTLQRQPNTMGFFSHARFVRGDNSVADEIALNPEYFASHGLKEILQTIVHEMVHLWQQHHGNPGRRGYHNKEWADFMEDIGLMPSSTGEPGGKRVGDSIADYPIAGGRFEQAVNQLLTKEFHISWYDRFPVQTPQDPELAALCESSETKPGKSNRLKYRCPKCEDQIWGKPGLVVHCGRDECSMAEFRVVI